MVTPDISIFRDVLMHTSDAVFLTDDLGQFKFICPNVSHIFGYTESEVDEMSTLDQLIGSSYQMHIRTERPSAEVILNNFEETIIDKHGEKHHLLINVKQTNLLGATRLITCCDITERKNQEVANKLELDRYKMVLNSIPDMVWIKDCEGTYQLCNKAFAVLNNRTISEVIGSKDSDLVMPEIFEIWRKTDQKVIEGRKPLRNEVILGPSPGIIAETTIAPYYDKNQDVIGVLGIARNVTECRMKEKELLKLTDLYNASQSMAKIGTWRYDKRTNEIKWTPQLYLMFGLNPNEPPPPYEIQSNFLTADSWTLWSEVNRNALTHGTSYDIEVETSKLDTDIEWLNVRGEVIRDEHGEIVGLTGFAQDITEKKKYEIQLREFINGVPDPIYWVNEKGDILNTNEAACKMTGYTREELVGAPMNIINQPLPEDDGSERSKQKNSIYYLESFHKRKDGSLFPVETNVRTFDLGGKSHYFAISRDITGRKEHEKELEKLTHNLLQSQKTAKLGSWWVSLDSDESEWSDECYNILEIAKEKPSVKLFYSMVHPEELAMVQAEFNKCLNNGEEYSLTHRVITGDGKVKYVRGRASLAKDNLDKPIIWGTLQDVTHEMEYQQDLEARDRELLRDLEKFKVLLESGKLVAFEADLRTNEIQTIRNSEIIESASFPVNEISDFRDFFSRIREEHQAFCMNKMYKLQEGEISNFSCEFQVVEGGKYHWHLGIMSILDVSPKGEVEKVFVTLRNIEQEKSEEVARLIGQENERLRVSRDIHDSIGQMLFATRMMIKNKLKKYRDLAEIDEMLLEMIKESRFIINNFGVSLQDNTLKSAFEELAQKMGKIFDGKIEFQWEGSESVDDLKLATYIFRIYQEALSNAIKYSQSPSIQIKVKISGHIYLDVIDQGKGFKPENNATGFGMSNMAERCREIRYKMDIESEKGRGTRISVRPNI